MKDLNQNRYQFRAGLRGLVMVLFITLTGCQVEKPQKELYVSAAASLQESLEVLVELYEQEYPGVQVHLNFGGSNVLKHQIVEGFEVDLFLSAHMEQVEELIDLGLVEVSAPFAGNEVVLVTSSEKIQTFEDIADEGVRLIFANEAVPIGVYSQEILTRVDADFPGFKAATMANVISKEDNVRQVLLKVSLGEGDGAFVYRTDALVALEGMEVMDLPEAYQIQSELYMALVNGVVEIKAEASDFYDFVLGEVGQEVLRQHGFQ